MRGRERVTQHPSFSLRGETEDARVVAETS